MNDRELITGLDVCRPASDDLRQPELRALADHVANDPRADEIRVQLIRIDSALTRTMHAATVPEGLEDRLLGELQKAAGEAAIGDLVGSDVSEKASPAAPAPRDPPITRRRWLAWSGGLAAAAAGLIAVIVLRTEKELTNDNLLAAATWHEALVETNGWRPLDPASAGGHALPAELLRLPSRFRDATRAVGRSGTAYDLSIAGGPRATLFIIEQAVRVGAPQTAPQRPQLRTQGYSIAYWQRGETIYVVAIESDRFEDYRALLESSTPMAV
jgi:hypothetical protein